MPETSRLVDDLRPTARALPQSGIVKVFNHGIGKPGLIPLWAGEGDLPTPAFIVAAAERSLRAGETFYTPNRGIKPLREALATYTSGLYGVPVSADEFTITAGGMQAIQLAMQLLISPGDEVIVPTPAWPNFGGAVIVQGGRPVEVAMTAGSDGWSLSLDRLLGAVTPRTRVIIINSPSNPTGWTATREELAAILGFARARGIWIVADEIYARFHYGDGLAPSFLPLRQPGDRLLFVNTFSKNWAMTGWRIGWIQAPEELGLTIENHVQYNTSGVATFMQRAGLAALLEGEDFVKLQIARAVDGRRIVADALRGSNGVHYPPPSGAFYAFLAIDGLTDSMAAALRLVDEAGIGLAPGTAFGDDFKPFLRICFLRSPEPLQEAMGRLTDWLARPR